MITIRAGLGLTPYSGHDKDNQSAELTTFKADERPDLHSLDFPEEDFVVGGHRPRIVVQQI